VGPRIVQQLAAYIEDSKNPLKQVEQNVSHSKNSGINAPQIDRSNSYPSESLPLKDVYKFD
jgi:hypothetical protein